MKRLILSLSILLFTSQCFSQLANNKTLLWKISGKDLKSPSYLFGTIHMICADDILVSDSLKAAIKQANKVYLELDMDNMFELMSVMNKMKMRGDTTLSQLLSADEYQKVKSFFTTNKGLIPFSMLETYKPMLSASTLMQGSLDCDNAQAMEQLVMKEAKRSGIGIKGLETMAFQMSIFDSIPYGLQAKQLLQYVENYGKDKENKEFEELTIAYRNQDLNKLDSLTKKEEGGIDQFTEIMLYNRNADWVKKLAALMPSGSLVVAVGAGHLPGDR
ncbi:MAG: TraB/GumN family protein, partial [Flavobacterium sp.]